MLVSDIEQGLLSTYKARNQELRGILSNLNEEINRASPENPILLRELLVGSECFPTEHSLHRGGSKSEIEELRQERKTIKKHIEELLRVLPKDDPGSEAFSLRRIRIDSPPSEEEKSSGQLPKDPPYNEVVGKAVAFEPLSLDDDYRTPNGNSSGGLTLLDQDELRKIRSVGKEILRELGKKILSGNFNLTRVSFPIKCMSSRTALHNTLNTCIMFPLYLNKAASVSDSLERFRLVLVGSLSSFMHSSTFVKPLNPILGETLYGAMNDGSKLWAEQTCHHPPVSSFFVEGPGSNYIVYGFYNFSAKAGLNSVTIQNSGKKVFCFPDGQVISQNCPDEVFSGTFFGKMRHESLGVILFEDEMNRLECRVEFKKVKGRPSDYFAGIVFRDGIPVARLNGSYLGYIDFDGRRYWDARYMQPFPIQFETVIPSDADYREDLLLLRSGRVDAAQRAKEHLENIQRNDRKLRDDYS